MLQGEFFQNPGSAGASGFYSYQIEQSMRFDYLGTNSGTYLTRTPSSAGNRRTYTISMWVKRASFSNLNQLISAQVTSTTNYVDNYNFRPDSENAQLNVAFKGSLDGRVQSTAIFRDLTGWMHIVIRVDTTQSTASDRARIYVNGSQITDLSQNTYPSQDYEGGFGSTREHAVGWGTGGNNGYPFDGYMAEVILADGQSYAPTQFGETKNGVWIPKDPSGTSFGTTGFHLKFQNASALGDDSSGNNNDFSVTNAGADHQVLDSPTFGS